MYVFFVPVYPIDLVYDVPLIRNQLNLICDIFQCMLRVYDIAWAGDSKCVFGYVYEHNVMYIGPTTGDNKSLLDTW